MPSLILNSITADPGAKAKKIFYIEKGEGKETLLFVHGWFQNARDCFGPLIDRYAHHYHVFALDLPGHGSSYKEKGFSYGMYEAYEALEFLFWKIQKTHASVTVVGHSLGAFLSMQLAMNYPKDIQNVILISPVIDFGNFDHVFRRLGKIPLWLGNWFLFLRAVRGKFPFKDRTYIYDPEKGHRIPGHLQYYKIKKNNHPVHAARGYVNSFIGLSMESMITNFHSPVLFIYGAYDQLTPSGYGSSVAQKMVSAVFRVVEGAGHNVHQVRDEEVKSIIDDFLEEHRKKRTGWARFFPWLRR